MDEAIATAGGPPAAPLPGNLQGTWDEFMQKLARALGQLAPHKYFAIHVKGSGRYVEFTCGANGALRVESVSNAWLPEDQRLTESQGRKMVEMGWGAPSLLPGQSPKHPTGSTNYFLDAPPPVVPDRIASLATATLALIHGAQRPEDLEVRFGNAPGVMDWMPQALRAERMRANAWDDFVAKLAKALAELGEHRYFAIHVKGTARYVEFTAGAGGAMRVETVSNAWLPEDQRLTEAESRALASMGWIAPNLQKQAGKHLAGSPNYYFEARPPVAHERLAELARNTLATIHKAASPEDLEVRFGNAANMLDFVGR